MDSVKVTASLDAAARAIADARAELLRPDPLPVIRTSTALDAALAGTTPVLTLSPSLVYTTPLVLRRPVTLQCEGLADALGPTDRIEPDRLLPLFANGLTIPSDDVMVLGLEVRYPDPRMPVSMFTGARVIYDRMRILGDPKTGAKHALVVQGNGDCAVLNSIIDDGFSPYPSYDAQAIYCQEMAPGLAIRNCFLRGGTETVMFGGGDIASADRIPRRISITDCDLTKRAEWQALAVSVKNLLEFKNAIDVEVRRNRFSNCWGGRGQTGVAIVITPRNQDGANPFATCEHITIDDNDISDVASFLLITGDDDRPKNPSQIATDIRITNNRGVRIDPLRYTGTPHLIEISRGPRDVRIAGNDLQGTKISATVYFHSPARLCERLTVVDNQWPTSKYGVFGDAVAAVTQAATVAKYVNPIGSEIARNTTYPIV